MQKKESKIGLFSQTFANIQQVQYITSEFHDLPHRQVHVATIIERSEFHLEETRRYKTNQKFKMDLVNVFVVLLVLKEKKEKYHFRKLVLILILLSKYFSLISGKEIFASISRY